MNRINWMQVAVFGIVVLLVFLIGISLLSFGWGGDWGMMGRWWPFCGGTGRLGGGLFGLWGWLFMALMVLFPLGFLALLALGIIWLVRAVSGPQLRAPSAPPAAQSCPSCGKVVQADWKVCPYCGEELS
ncbi:MAG: zinc ribbon domain-containing protein [Dehalococcoidia bacterium]